MSCSTVFDSQSSPVLRRYRFLQYENIMWVRRLVPHEVPLCEALHVASEGCPLPGSPSDSNHRSLFLSDFFFRSQPIYFVDRVQHHSLLVSAGITYNHTSGHETFSFPHFSPHFALDLPTFNSCILHRRKPSHTLTLSWSLRSLPVDLPFPRFLFLIPLFSFLLL